MVNVIPQPTFAAAAFNSSRCNLHAHDAQQRPHAVAFIHGLGGSGYGTWGDFPRFAFEHLDVATFDFPNFLRRVRGGGQPGATVVAQVVESLRKLAQSYESIFLVGHSHGGLLAESAAEQYLMSRLAHGEQVTPLAGLVLLASPRAGSGWAPNWLPLPFDELKALRKSAEAHVRRDEFLSTHVERRNLASIPPGNVLCPTYVCSAGRDRWVSEFSAAFGIPANQRRHLATSHRRLVKPTDDDHEIVDWLREAIVAVSATRTQWRREQRRLAATLSAQAPDVAPTVITEFWGDPDETEWEEAYNDVRREASNAELLALDRRKAAPGAVVDLLIAVSKSQDVMEPDLRAQPRVEAAHKRRLEADQLSVGLAPVGNKFDQAAATIHGWLQQLPPAASVYVEGAPDVTALRGIMMRWLRMVMEQDPRRSRAFASQRMLGTEPRLFLSPGDERA